MMYSEVIVTFKTGSSHTMNNVVKVSSKDDVYKFSGAHYNKHFEFVKENVLMIEYQK